MSDAGIWAFLAVLWLLTFTAGGAIGAGMGEREGRDAMCAAACADHDDWTRTGTDCVCLDETERPTPRRSRHADR